MKRRLLALLLVVSLVASMCTTAFAGNHPGEKTEVNYVSLGDSMTNGYGLPGYDQNSGVEDYGDGSYANLFAQWLEMAGVEVDHAQLAMSAMRSEDLHWLLELDYTDDEAIALTDGDWDEEAWYDKFSTGDYWTWDEICTHSRTAATTEMIANKIGVKPTDERDVALIAQYYQEKVQDADIISLGMGNGNFGVFMFGRIMEAIGFSGEPSEAMVYNVERAIAECEPEMQEQILNLKDELYVALEEYVGVPVDDGDDETTTMMEAFANTVVYTSISYVLNYAGSVEAILQLNPDAEIILVALMNTFADEGESDDITIGDVMNVVFTPLNAYIAALPTYMQATGNSVYTDATFYYAEAADVECLVEVYGDDFYIEDENSGGIIPNADSTVRKRFVESIVGTPNEPGMVWGLLSQGDTFAKIMYMATGKFDASATLPFISFEDVLAPTPNMGLEKYVACVLYLAFEDAIIASTQNGAAVSLEAILGLGSLDMSLFEGVMGSLAGQQLSVETLSAALQNDPAVSGLLSLFGRCVIGNGLGAHPSAAGHEALSEAVIEAYAGEYTAADKTQENLIVVAKALADLVAEYYDEAYAYAYAEAKAAGYIDTAAAGIDAAIVALKGIDVSATEMTDEFKAELAGEIEEVIETLAAAKALITEADVLDQASMDALMAMLDEAGEAIENIKNLLKQAGVDVNDLVIVPALEKAYAELVNVVIPAIETAAEEIAAKAYEYLVALAEQAGEDLAEAYDAFVEAFLEFLPEADAWLYDWFYNNPDKVIAFFEENGEFFVENAEAAATILGYIANTFGPEALEWVMENPEEALEQFVSWYEKYGERTWAMILVYLNELGVLECLPTEEDIKAAIDAIEKQIEDCYKQLENATGEALEELEATIEELKAAVEELKAMVEGYAQMLDKAVRAEIEAAIEKLENAVAELEAAVQELKAAIEAQIEEAIAKAEAAVKEALAKVEAAIAKVEAAVNGVIADVNETIKEVYAALEKAKEELVAGAVQIVENLKDALADLYDVIVDNSDKIDDAVLAEIIAAFEDIEDALEKLDAIIKGAANAAIEDVAAELKSALAELQDAVEALIEAVEDNADEIIEEAVAAFEQAYLDATTDEYTITKDSYYVAIGDETVLAEPSYADMLAEALEVEYTKIGEEGLTVAGTEAVLMQNIAEIVKADLITLGYSNNTMISFMIDQATSLMPEELDWSVYGYDELGEYVDAALSDITEELYAQGMDAQTTGLMVTAIESYAFAYTGYMVGYPMVVEAIHEINPEALVIMVGMNNALADVTLEAEGVEFAIGEYVEYLVDAANIESLAYAMLTGNAIYVDAPVVETMLEAYDVELGTDMITVLQLLAFPQNRALLNPSEAGHDYIKEQILNALELDYEYLLGDVNLDGEVNSADTNLLFRFVMKRLDEGFTALQMWAGDVNEDGDVNSADTNLLFRYVMKYIPTLGAQAQ